MKVLPIIEITMFLASNEAVSSQYQEIEPEHLFIAILKISELDFDVLKDKAEFKRIEELPMLKSIIRDLRVDAADLRRKLRRALGLGGSPLKGKTMHRSAESRRLFDLAGSIADEEGAVSFTAVHLLKAILKEPTSRIADLLPRKARSDVTEPADERAFRTGDIFNPEPEDDASPKIKGLGALTETLKNLRNALRDKVFGQDHAIQAFIEGVFNAEVVANADDKRRRPKGIFVFAGPPGVGKTFLAESAAEALARPFKRFDMSGFSDHQSGMSLVGMNKSYKDSHPGLLTEFVQKNPNALLLFDEIEKAHLNVVHLFLQALDAGRLEDVHNEQEVQFRDTLIIFTTNAGKALYDDPNAAGVYAVSANFHRKTILDALESETDQRTGKPFFPQAICSRMATGYPLMFNRLGVNDLERVALAELDRMSNLMEKEYSKKLQCGPLVPLCMVLREGVHTDARTVRSQVESFVKAEIFNFSKLFKPGRLEAILKKSSRIVIDLDSLDALPEEARKLLTSTGKPRILLVGDEDLGKLWSTHINEADWKLAWDEPDVQAIIHNEELDLVILDLLMGPGTDATTILASGPMTQR